MAAATCLFLSPHDAGLLLGIFEDLPLVFCNAYLISSSCSHGNE